MKRAAIIGGGACGLLLAGLIRDSFDVTIFEKNDKLGKKILASGNGKCNFTNSGDYINKYNNDFASELVNHYNNELIRKYFSSLGLGYRIDEEKRVYPLSESSQTILNVLKKKLDKARILLDSRVNKIVSLKEGVQVFYNENSELFDYVICSTGSEASNLGSRYAYDYLKEYGLEFEKLTPSLVPIIVSENVSSLEGVRVKCLVSLYEKNNLIYKEPGEVLFKKDGLSGIVIYNISSLINRNKNGDYSVSLDLCNDLANEQEITNLDGLVHPKLVEFLKGKDPRNVTLKVTGLYDKTNAQVISGGVNLKEINDDLSLKKDSRIFVGGEVLDCDGMCGGYNLQFAFSCAFKIRDSLNNNRVN